MPHLRRLSEEIPEEGLVILEGERMPIMRMEIDCQPGSGKYAVIHRKRLAEIYGIEEGHIGIYERTVENGGTTYRRIEGSELEELEALAGTGMRD
jgi:hypothetical protein